MTLPSRTDAMTELVLIGAGGLTRETLEVIAAINDVDPAWKPIAILDDDTEVAGTHVARLPVVGPVEAIDSFPNAAVVICVASPTRPNSRKAISERLGCRGVTAERFATLIHPAASLARTTSVGHGSVIMAGVVSTADVTIGRHAIVMPGTVLTHDDVVADYVTSAAGVRLAGGVHVGEGAYLGAGAVVREHRTIDAGAVVGMGAVVIDDVPAGDTWVGCPARPLGSDRTRP